MVNIGTQPFRLRVDNHSPYCNSNKRTEFLKGMVPFDAKVSGIGGSVTVRHKGTVQWVWDDNLVQTTVYDIPDTLFMPDSPARILSPHHWAQGRASRDKDDSSHCITDPHSIRLVWAHGEHSKTVAMDPDTNVAILRASPEVTLDALTNVVSDKKFDPGDPSDRDSVGDISFAHPSEGEPTSHDSEGATNTSAIPQSPRTVTFDLGADSQPSVVPGNTYELEETLYPQQLYLRWHHRLNHLSYTRMKRLIDAQMLPATLKDIKPPCCAACLISRSTRRPWRTKSKHYQKSIPDVKGPGDCVSVDQIQSTTPGIMAQIRGFITKKRYFYATIYADHQSSLGFLHLQKSYLMIETIQEKDAFESYAQARGVIIKHYHADNGRFA